MQRLADYIAEFLLKHGIKDVFMLTGYGSMYMNDAIEMSGINYYATRNEATAPMMAEAYARVNQSLGVVCVTAGPGATNAIPGLAEAFVDSAPVMVLSGQVDKRHTTHAANIKGLRTFGTAEINIVPIVKPLTKFAAVLDDPNDIRYLLEKAFYYATSGRPGPVWIDIPLDLQQCIIDPDNLRGFEPDDLEFGNLYDDVSDVIDLLRESKRPLYVCGHGVRQSQTVDQLKDLLDLTDIPVFFSRLGQDLLPHSHPKILGHAGIKGSKYCKRLMGEADLVIVLGCRLAVQFVGHNFEAFRNAKVVMIDIDEAELMKPGVALHKAIHADLTEFLPMLISEIKEAGLPGCTEWLSHCHKLKADNPMVLHSQKRNPIDLYYFMDRLGDLSNDKHILVTDAGSNYYVGGQVWQFENGQREITSGTNAAMGTTIPLAVGAAVAKPDFQILAVTGDGSLELNIQELKTISHYNFNIKLFVINNGGYVSMKRWQDTFFEGRRIDTEESTGVGTLDMRRVAAAFDLNYKCIDDWEKIDTDLMEIIRIPGPTFIEVMTDNEQRIIDGFADY